MADLHNLLGDIQSDDEAQAPPATIDNEVDEPWDRNDRERLDLPPALQEAERKRYQTVDEDIIEDEEDVLEEDREYAQLKRLWKLEMNCPDLMPFDAETIGLQLELLEGQDEIVEKLSARFDTQLAPLMGSIYKMDADRVRFMLTDLLRMRLTKIEEHPLYMRDMVDRMSNDEVAYLRQYGELLERHLKRTVLDHLPKDAWKKLDEEEMIDFPNLQQFVFCKILEKVEIDMDGIQEHEAGACLIARYDAIRELVLEGKIEMLL